MKTVLYYTIFVEDFSVFFGRERFIRFHCYLRKIFQNEMENDYVIFQGWKKGFKIFYSFIFSWSNKCLIFSFWIDWFDRLW